MKIDSVSITRPSLADIFFISITFSTLGYYFPVLDADLDQLCLPHEPTLGARDFSSAVSGFRFSGFAARGFGLRPTPKIPIAREKNL